MYDANLAPDVGWLSSAPADKLRWITAFHAANRLPSGPLKSHAALHLIVEDDLARGRGPVVRAMARLQQQGMARHAALHAVGAVLAAHRSQQAQAAAGEDVQRRLIRALNALVPPLDR